MKPNTRTVHVDAGVPPVTSGARWVPFALTTLRVLLAPVIILLAALFPQPLALAGCVVVGVASDILDGVIARRLGVATPILRRYDSAADVVFFLAVLAGIWIVHPHIAQRWAWGFAVLLLLECVCLLLSLVRFGRPPATHTWCAKAWGLVLCCSCTAMLAFGFDGWLAWVALIVGSVADLEVIAIMAVSKEQPVDVKSIFLLRAGMDGPEV